jgi:hypothetical protein
MRKYLTAVMAVALVACVANVGTAFAAAPDKTTFDGEINASNPGATFTNSGLFAEATTLLNADPGTPTNPTVEPVPGALADVSFDHNIRFAPTSVPVCNNALSGTTQAGMKACGNSYVGGGYATLCAASGGPGTACDLGVLNAQVSAYNGPPNPQPTILMQGVSDHTPIGPLTVVLTGTLKPASLGGEFAGGKHLVVPIPLLASGAAALTDFSVNINNGKYVQAKCDGDNAWQYSAKSTFVSGTPRTATDSQPCT